MPDAPNQPNIILILVDDTGFSDLGDMGANLGTPAYQGFVRNDSATIAEALREAGYFTAMPGKWHVGADFMAREVDSWRVGDVDHPTPRQRGFDRFYGIVDGATHFFSPHYVMEDDGRAETSPSEFYFTDAITDQALRIIDEADAVEKPFFLYLAHAAPHWPLHAHVEDIARHEATYRGRRVLDHLKTKGIHDDTLILLLSHIGGCAEFMAEDGWARFMPDTINGGRRITMGNRPGLRPGGPLTYQSLDPPWANVSNAPCRLFKHWVHEGNAAVRVGVQDWDVIFPKLQAAWKLETLSG